MKTLTDEEKMSFPISIWDKMLYDDVQEIRLDVYYNDKGYPANIHDLGAADIDKYRIALINEICKRNGTEKIWRISSDAFAIEAKDSNCGSFELQYKGLILKILKKTVLIKCQ